MKRILITGENGFIGRSFADFLSGYPDGYACDFLSMRTDSWRNESLSGYDAILHAAGMVHRQETVENREAFFRINRDMTLDLAKKAKSEGVRQFVFISTGAVFGKEITDISKKTEPNPCTYYGQSKLEAEQGLSKMRDDGFIVAIVRPLMVYGKGCKGNFPALVALVKHSPVFPLVHNHRSLIYIENLTSFLKMIIDNRNDGLFHPQNEEYADTCVMAEEIAKSVAKRIHFSRLLGVAVILMRRFDRRANKAFGDMKYIDADQFDFSYCVCGFRESIRRSV